jgi:D-glycero-alpha-D-manno-heptose 1-phosphate guanylyltransferase
MIEAIVLAGGLGTRLREVVSNLPKPMAPVAGRPFLEILLGHIAQKGIGRVVLSVGFMAEKITAHFGNRFAGMELDYVVETSPLGTGGAVRMAMTKCSQDHVFVFNGDTFLDLETGTVESQWQQHHQPIIVGREVPDTNRYGRLLIDHGRVIGFAEKGGSGPGVINAGCYVLNASQLDAFQPNTAFSLELEYFNKALEEVYFDVYITSGVFIDIGVPEDYARAQIKLAEVGIKPPITNVQDS